MWYYTRLSRLIRVSVEYAAQPEHIRRQFNQGGRPYAYGYIRLWNRTQSIQPESTARPRTTIVPPPTLKSSEPGPQDFAQQPMSTSFIEDASRPNTPAQSFFEPSIIEPSITGPVEDAIKAIARTASPRYRDHLRNHGIHIDILSRRMSF